MKGIKKEVQYNLEKDKSDYQFQKYGLVFLEDGKVLGPKRPEYFSKTPKFNYENTESNLLEKNKEFLSNNFEKPFSAQEHQEQILSIANNIVQDVVGRPLTDFAHIIIMPREDFGKFREKIKDRLKNERGVVGDFHGINMGGVAILEDSGEKNCFPLLFHEIGHCLYPDTNDNYKDEFRAMYFQILCTKRFEIELGKNGLNFSYPDDYYEHVSLPTKDHELAFRHARLLYNFQNLYEDIVKGNKYAERMQADFLKIIGQDVKSF